MKIQQDYELVPVDEIEEHPNNPRRGDVDAIGESIDVNGWYGAVVAQKGTGYILAGNHRYRVAKKKGATEIPVIWLDVDDVEAIRILLADNRTAELGHTDEGALQELLSGLKTLDGTGYGLSALQAVEEAREAEEAAEEAAAAEAPVPDDRYTPAYGIMIECPTEADQERIYEWLLGEGLGDDVKLRVVAV